MESTPIDSKAVERCLLHGAELKLPYASLAGRIAPYCATCRAEQMAADDAARRVERLAQIAASQRRQLVERSNLSARYLGATFENFHAETQQQADVRDACQTFAERFEPCQPDTLWLLGNVGTGKTHLSAAIVNTIMADKMLQGVLITPRGIVSALRETWGQPDSRHHESKVINWLTSADLLVLDDLGVGNLTEFDKTQLLDVVDGRYAAQRPTVLTTNLRLSDIESCLGARVYDRLREGAKLIALGWDSYRGRL